MGGFGKLTKAATSEQRTGSLFESWSGPLVYMEAISDRSRRLRRDKDLISGVFNVNKPAGMTSHDVVVKIRKASGQRRVGHAGTLDPMATGVLLICMGQATRIAEYLMAGRKVYQAWMHLGITTDTYDATGKVTGVASELSLSLPRIEEVVSSFIGRIDQVPPMHSAIKHEGRSLYRLARQGIEVEREARTVEIYDFRIQEWTPPILKVEIVCSKGTYIRSLAHDLGQALGCGAHLAKLERTASGSFLLAEAIPLQELLNSLNHDSWRTYLIPIDVALTDFPALRVSQEAAERIRHGQQIETIAGSNPEPDALHRAYSENGEFIAILKYDSLNGRWQPVKVFASD